MESPPYLKIYPNPSGNSFSILVPDITEKYSMTLYDFTGKIILTEKDVRSGEKFMAPDHCSGIYNVVLKNEKGMQYQQKLMIIKN